MNQNHTYYHEISKYFNISIVECYMLMNKILLMLVCIANNTAASTLSGQDSKITEERMITLFKSKTRHAAQIKKIIIKTQSNYAIFKLLSNDEDKVLLQKEVSKKLKVISNKNAQQAKYTNTGKTRYANTFIKSSALGLLGDIYTYIAKQTARDAIHIDTSEDMRELDDMNVVLSEHDYVRYELEGLTKTAIIDEVCSDGVLTITITDKCICNPIKIKVIASENMSIKIESSMIAKVVCDEGRFNLDIAADQVFLDIFSGNLINLNVHASSILDGFIMNYAAYNVHLHAIHYHLGIHAKVNLLSVLIDEFQKGKVKNDESYFNTNNEYGNACHMVSRIKNLQNQKGQCLYLDAMLLKQIAINNNANIITVDVI